jgi:hypothetical protein
MKRVEPFLKVEPVLDYEARPLSIWRKFQKRCRDVTDEIDRTGWLLLIAACVLFCIGIFLLVSGQYFSRRAGESLIFAGAVPASAFYRRCLEQGRL